MDAYRQAAMCLHGLEDGDRDWLLNRLPKEHSAVLSELLAELKTLGIPREAGLSRDLLPAFVTGKTRNRLSEDFAELERASPESVWLLLQNESDSVVRALVMGRDWSWRGYILKQYRKKYRRDLTGGRPVGSKTFQALVAVVAKRLRETVNSASRHADRMPWYQRLRKSLWLQ